MSHNEIITLVTQETIMADNVLVTQTPCILNFGAQTETLTKEIIIPVTQETILIDDVLVT